MGANPVCSGTKTYTWTYTDCSGTTGQWVYTYTISPPTFTLPADGGSTVACISDAQVVPTPPVVNNSCGSPLTITGPVVGANPVCSGTKTYTWTYTDCTGTTGQWVYTYTITPPTATLPGAGGSTVACISNAQVVPTPPIVNNSCGDPLSITGPVIGADPVCSGTKTYTWTYTDCTGATSQWVYTYTITPPTFTLPANGGSTVVCISNAQTVPTPPTVNNSCGAPLTLTGPVISPDPACSGTKTYTWTYTDCTGTSGQWVYTYTISPPTFTLPVGGSSTVPCIADAQVLPTPPVVNNSCGTPLAITGPVIGPDPACSGPKTYTWTYTDCTGTTGQWVYTYTVSPPTFSVPANGGSTVPCIIDAQIVPTPPTVLNSCGNPVTPTGPVVGADPVCSGTKTYTWTYTDCSGSASVWIYTYTISQPTFVLPADDGLTVSCVGDAQAIPIPPSVDNSCGAPLTVTGPVIGPDPVCSGPKTYTWTYTDCTGTTGDWVYTYTVSPPAFTLPADGGSTVACISDAQLLPTPPAVNNSCGDPLSLTGPVIGSDPVCSGTKTYTWTYTDCTGTSGQWVYTYTINPPTVTMPANGGSTVACIIDAQVVPTPPVVINSCGAPLTVTGPVVGPDPVCSGTKTYTWSYTDCTGATQPWVYTYTINPPSATLPPNGGSTVACISAAQTVPTPPVVNNSCGNPLAITGPVVGADPVCSGTKTYTWTYTDCTGSSGQWVYTYTITPPTFTLPAGGGSTVPCISDAQTVPTPPVVNNSCGSPVAVTGPVIGTDPVCSGTKTYTWTYTDCTGTSGQWVYTYTVSPPTFTVPANSGSTVPCIIDAQVVPTPPVVNNSCGNPVTPTGPVVGADPVCSGTKTYTWTYTDCSGNANLWVYTYTISAPTFVLPANGGSTVSCITDAQAIPTPPSVDNSCGNPMTITGPVIGPDPACSGPKTYTWTYTDCTGTFGQWVYTYTISPPAFTLPPDDGSTVSCVSDAQAIPTPPAVNNSCGTPLIITGPTIDPDPVCSGTKSYIWEYKDCTGATLEWAYTYTITPPSSSLPPDGSSTVACISDAQVIPTPPGATNSCGDPLTVTGPVVSADPACSGTKVYTWTFTDCTGASQDWTYTYTISPPTFTLPANGGSTVACIGDAQTLPVPPPVTNSCGAPLTQTGPVIGADPVCSGTKTYTWTFTDCTGTSGQWVYTYTISAPTFTLPPNGGSTVACASDAQVIPTAPVVNNSCGTPLTLSGPVVSADPACSGTKTYTFTYTDCTGGSAQWIYTYTITGDTGPVFSAPPADVSVPCVADIPAMISLTYTNDCSGGGSVVGTDSPLSGSCPATITRTWTVTDACGNAATVTQLITVNDNIPPTASNPPSIVVSGCNMPVPAPDISFITDAADNCSVPVVAFAGDVTNLVGCTETTTRSFTVTDACNNSITVTQLITRTVDTTPPVFTNPPADISYACINQVPPMADLAYTDNCSPSGTVMGTETGPSGNPLTITRTWTFTDACGNPVTYTQTITITELVTTNNIVDDACDGDTYTLPDGSTTTVGGLFGPYTFTGSNGCDSIVNVDLTFHMPNTGSETYNGCAGDGYSVTVGGTVYNEGNPSGTEVLTNSFGCDSIVTIDLMYGLAGSGNENYIGCSGDGYSVVVGGTTYNEGLPFGTETLTGINGCDSVVTVLLVFNPTSTGTETYSGCQGDGYSVVVNGNTYDETTPNGVEVLTGYQGCDSTVTITLTFAPAGFGNESYSGCTGDGYTIVVNGTTYDESNPIGIETFPGSGGCDSTVTINLTFNQTSSGDETYSGCAGDGYSVVVGGTLYNEANPTGTETLTNVFGCDSIVDINLAFAPNSTGIESYSGCQNDGYSVVVNGTIYDESNPTGTETLVNAAGCDSVVTISLVFAPAGMGTETHMGCEGDGYSVIVNGTTYDENNPSGTESFPGPNGCDSIVNIDLTFSPVLFGMENYSGCIGDGYSIVVNGTVYDEFNPAGTETLISSLGCDSIVDIDLSFSPTLMGDETYSGCSGDGYTVIVNGTIYDESNPTGTETITGAGCDSIVSIDLNFAPVDVAMITALGPLCTEAGVQTLAALPPGGIWSGAVSSDQFDPATLGNGTHEVIYTSPAGPCQTADTIQVVVYEMVLSCQKLQDETSPGANDGRAEITISGGMPPYDITWTGPTPGSIMLAADGNFVISSLAPGPYTVEVVDATGCTTTCQFFIISGVPCDLVIDDISIQNATCSGVEDGVITVTASSSMPPLQYSLDGDPYVSTNVFTMVAPGTHTISVLDAANCAVSQIVFVDMGPSPVLGIDQIVDASCGVNNGSIDVNVTGGSSPYNYSIDGIVYGFSDLFPGLFAGNYQIYLIDNAGCTDTIPATVIASGAPVITSIDIEDSSCGNSDGSITINATGGQGTLMYSIDGGATFQSSNFFDNLPAGVYPIVVQDDAGCPVNGTATLQDIGAPVIDPINITPTSCGASDGSITIIATGTGTLQYSINGGASFQNSNVFTGLPVGTYPIVVRDGNGCLATSLANVGTTNGPQITDVNSTNTSCGEPNGSIEIIASGGSGTLMYSIDGGATFEIFNIFTDLPDGDYDIVVKDDNDCEATDFVTIAPSSGPDFDVYITPAHCGLADGCIELDGFDGQGPYTYSMTGLPPFSPVFQFCNKVSDFYTVAIKDANGCIHEEDVFLYEAPEPNITGIISTNPLCGETTGMILVNATGVGLMYSKQLPVYQDSNKFVNVLPGTYTITVRDSFGCTDTGMAVITATPTPILSLDTTSSQCGMNTGIITATATGGVTPYQYKLNNGAFGNNNVFSGLGAGTYTVIVRGNNGCTDTVTVDIISVGTQTGALDDSFCAGGSYTIDGNTYTSPGVYTISITGGASNGCDSVLTLTLTEDPLIEKEITESICAGGVYTYNGVDYTIENLYVLDTLPAAVGCDSILILNLIVNPLETTYIDTFICTGGMITIGGIDYTSAGTYLIDTISAAVGCDSVRFLRLSVADYNQNLVTASICQGDTFTINGIDYTMTGLYVVDTLAGPNSCDTILSLDLTVNPLPTADAGADQLLDCQSQTVTLDGSGTGGSPLWTGPGINAGNENQFTPDVTQPGTYYLTVTSPQNCTAVDSVVVSLDPATVIADAGPDAFFSCDIDTVILQAGPLGPDYTYQWTGPGINASNEHSPNPIITEPGMYTLVVTNTVTQCVSAPDVVDITDISVVIIAIIQDPENPINCYITSVDLDATGSSVGPNIVYTWFDAEGHLVSSSPGFPVTSGGMFTLIVEDTISGCFDNDSIFVEDLTEYPPAEAGNPQVIDCNNTTVILNDGAVSTFPDVVFQWTGPVGGIIGADTLLSVLVGTPGFYYYLTALDTASGCQNMDSVFVTDMTTLPTADIDVEQIITCIDSTALLDIGNSSGGPGFMYVWSGPGTNSVIADSIQPTAPGQYFLEVLNQATGCASMDSVILTLPMEPQDLLANINIPICAGDASGTITINNVTGGTPVYMYSIDGGPVQTSPTFEDLFAGNYSIAVVDANGCVYAESFTVPEGLELTIDIGPDINLVLGDSVTLWADVSLPWSQIDSIVWTPLDILSCTYCTNPVLYGLQNDVVTATVYTGGCVDQDMLTVRVDVDANIYIPNVFSPNDDGINDYVTVFTDHRVRKVVFLEIFDRWGNQVFVKENFDPNDPSLGWDGSFRGKKMNPAVFAYSARVELINGDTIDRKGDITIVR